MNDFDQFSSAPLSPNPEPDRENSRLLATAFFTGMFLALFYIVGGYTSSTDDQGKVTVMLSCGWFLQVFIIAAIAGYVVSQLVSKIQPAWEKKDTERASLLSIGAVFAAGLCTSGACILPAALGAIGGLLLMLPFRLGSLIASTLQSKNKQ